MTIGERIKKLREAKNISQIDLATSVQLSKQNLYKYENNIITNIPSDKIELIANALGVSPSYLMGWENNCTTEIENLYNLLDSEDKAEVRGLIKGMLRAEKYNRINIADDLANEIKQLGAFSRQNIKK